MSSNPLIISNHPTSKDRLLSTNHNNRNHFFSSSSTNSSPSSDLSTENPVNSSSLKHRKDSTWKVPYPVLSDHRDPSSVLILLQKETQTTSKKISDVSKQINECERRLISNHYTENEKKTFKSERVKFKQQLDGLKKHERRVSLQIDFITTKSEIKGLEDEQNSNQSEQIKILLGKLKQKSEKMKIYMRTRNEQMKKISNGKQDLITTHEKRKSSSQNQQHFQTATAAGKDSNRKRSSTSTNDSHVHKRFKPTTPVIRLTSRVTSHESKQRTIQPPIVRFIDKTTNAKISSASPASSSSTSSPPLIPIRDISTANQMQNSLPETKVSLVDDDDDDLEGELNIDELFNDDSYSEQTVQRSKVELNELIHHRPVKQNT